MERARTYQMDYPIAHLFGLIPVMLLCNNSAYCNLSDFLTDML